MTLRRRLGAALVALLLATSACDIEVKESAHDLRDERIVGDLTFELDLSDPPSADELEVDPDAQYDIYTAPDKQPIVTTITLLDDTSFTIEVQHLTAVRDLGEFHEIQLSTPYLDRDDYVAAVEEFASLGAPQAQIDRMIDWVDRPDGGIFGFNGEALIPQPVGYDLHLTGFLEGGHLSLEYSVVWPSEVGRDR